MIPCRFFRSFAVLGFATLPWSLTGCGALEDLGGAVGVDRVLGGS
jgi:hypothetical protein